MVLGQTVLVHISSSFCLGINTKVRGHRNGQLGSSSAQHPYGPSPKRGAERRNQCRSMGVAVAKSLITASSIRGRLPRLQVHGFLFLDSHRPFPARPQRFTSCNIHLIEIQNLVSVSFYQVSLRLIRKIPSFVCLLFFFFFFTSIQSTKPNC